MKALLKRLIQAIKSLVKKIVKFIKGLFGKKEIVVSVDEPPEIKEIPPPPPREATYKEAVRMKRGREGKAALYECFFGTLVDRDPTESSLKRKKHAKDGWRHGVSHPFVLGKSTFDVQRSNDASLELYDKLMVMLAEMEARE